MGLIFGEPPPLRGKSGGPATPTVGQHIAPISSGGNTRLPARYAFLPAKVADNITNQFLAKL